MPNTSGQEPRPTEEMTVPRFRLYIYNQSLHSQRAQANFRAFADHHLAGHYELEIVDVACEPLRALNEGVLVTPLLVRLSPPFCRVVGSLSDVERMRPLLGLKE